MITMRTLTRAAAATALLLVAACSTTPGDAVQVPMTEASYQNLYGVHVKDDCDGITGAVCGNAL